MNPWLILGVVLAWIASLGAVGVWQHDAGVTSERVVSQKKENTQLVAANKELDRLRGLERASAAQIAAIGDTHAQQVADLKAQHARDLANLRAGALRLRVPGACSPAARAGEVPAPASGSDAATTGELPQQITSDLLDLADDADTNTIDLATCQAVVTSYLKTQESP